MDNLTSQIIKKTRKAIIDYNMIPDNSGIMVGLSGGKDSLALLYMLKRFLVCSRYKFPLAAGHVDLGFGDNLTFLKEYCAKLEVPFYCEPTNISQVVFDVRQESNPCSLCAKMRRGALNNLAKKNGYNKVALAHHLDDVVETFMLNTFFESRLDAFKPVTWLSNQQVWVIRPFIYVPEAMLSQFAAKESLLILKSCCPANSQTKRQDMKELLSKLEEICPHGKEQALRALQRLPNTEWQTLKDKAKGAKKDDCC